MDKRIKKLILTALFSAMSVLLYLFPKFSLPIFPSFLEMNFSMLPIMILGFACGAMYGGLGVLLRYISNLIIEGSITAGVGEIMDLMLGAAVVIPASLIYRFIKVKEPKKTLFSLLAGLIIWIAAGAILNVFYAVPLYLKLYFNGNVNALVGALHIIPGINASNYMIKYIIFAVIPFNFILGFVVMTVTFLVNKRISILYVEDDEVIDTNDEEVLEEENANAIQVEKLA